MKYKIKVVRKPSMTCFSMLLHKTQQDMCNEIVERGEVSLNIDHKTKTTLSVIVSSGECSFHCSYIPKGCEDLKFHTKSGWNAFWGYQETINYFKILKSQKWEAFRRYGIALVESLHLDTDKGITIRFLVDEQIMDELGVMPTHGFESDESVREIELCQK